MKKQQVYSSRTADKFVIRLPDEMREQIAEIARNHHRSMNSQIISWLTLCVELEMAGIPVTRDTLSEAASYLQGEGGKPASTISYGETVQVPERYLNIGKDNKFETNTEVVQVFALGVVAAIKPDGNDTQIQVRWLHRDQLSDWIPFSDVERNQ